MHKITDEYLASQGLSKTTPRRFFSKILTTRSCWIWIGYKNRLGYGYLCTGRHAIPENAHRISWMLHFGPTPKGKWVLHDCPGGDNPSCVNPAHLWLGTHADNQADMAKKNRSAFGERHGMHKLTFEQVNRIRSNGGRLSDAARRFGVTPAAISMIRNRKRWDHLTSK